MQAYHQSASTLNLLRAFTKGGFADLGRVHVWTQEFVASSPEGQRYEQLAVEIDRALRFMRACGIDTEGTHNLHEVDVYTSHEALLLGYEEALTRQDSLTGGWYDCSAHMLWIGERTRQLDGAHVEFLRGVGNPIGCKIGPTTDAEFVLELCERLNPARIPGRLTLISRMGADQGRGRAAAAAARGPRRRPPGRVGLRPDARQHDHQRVRAARPATSTTIMAEIAGFVRAHQAEGTWPGGIHVELTGDNVTECLGGADKILDSMLDDRYQTMCDPRLNGRQSLDLAFHVAELLRDHRPGVTLACRCEALRLTARLAGRRTSPPRSSARRRDRRPIGDDRPPRSGWRRSPRSLTGWATLVAVEEGIVDARPAGRPARLHAAPPAGPRRRLPVRRRRPDQPARAAADLQQPGHRAGRRRRSAEAAGMPFADYLDEAVLAAARA